MCDKVSYLLANHATAIVTPSLSSSRALRISGLMVFGKCSRWFTLKQHLRLMALAKLEHLPSGLASQQRLRMIS